MDPRTNNARWEWGTLYIYWEKAWLGLGAEGSISPCGPIFYYVLICVLVQLQLLRVNFWLFLEEYGCMRGDHFICLKMCLDARNKNANHVGLVGMTLK